MVRINPQGDGEALPEGRFLAPTLSCMADYEGKIIEFLDGGATRLALVTRQSGDKVQVLDERGRHDRVSISHIVVVHRPRTGHSDFPITSKEIQSQVESVKAGIDPELLWESVLQEERTFDLTELADLYFGDHEAIHRSALFRALAEDGLHFKRKGTVFAPRTRQQVVDQLLAAQRRREREERIECAVRWIQQVLESETQVDVPSDMVWVVQHIEDFLLRKKVNEVAGLLGKARPDLTEKEVAFEVLMKSGRLDQSADPLLVIAGIEERFPRRAIEQAQGLPPFSGDTSRGDFTSLTAISIDDEDTLEVDDALTVQWIDDRLRLGIHIADVAYFVGKNDPLDDEASRRCVSMYLPTQTVTMFPEALSYDRASLNHDQLRPTLSFELDLDSAGNVLDWRLCRGQIRVSHRLSYSVADQSIQSNRADELGLVLQRLTLLSEQLTDQRLAQGAIIIRRPELKVRVKDDLIILKILDSNSPSRRLVSEVMILANRLAAQFAAREGVPLIYRVQEGSQTPPGLYGGDPGYDAVAMNRLLKGMRRSRLSLSPLRHEGLGLDAYTQLTSPIRRFADVVIQRQLSAFLAGESLPYEREELLDVLTTAEAAERDMRALERKATRYWILEHLARQGQDDLLEGWVVDEIRGGYLVELNNLFVIGYLPVASHHQAGEVLKLSIEGIDPKKDILRLKEAG